MKANQTLFLTAFATSLFLSGCGGGVKSSASKDKQPHKVSKEYGNLEVGNNTYASVSVDNSKYFFEYGSAQPHVQVYIDNDLDTSIGYTMWEDSSIGVEYLIEDI